MFRLRQRLSFALASGLQPSKLFLKLEALYTLETRIQDAGTLFDTLLRRVRWATLKEVVKALLLLTADIETALACHSPTEG